MSHQVQRFWSPLINFKSDVDNIELSHGFRISKSSPDEMEIQENIGQHLPTRQIGRFLLHYESSADRDGGKPPTIRSEARTQMEKAIALLRLYKGESVGFELIVQPLDESDPSKVKALHLGHYILWADPKTKYARTVYHITGDETEGLQKFFQAHFNSDSFHQLDTAIDYFNKSYIEPYTPRDSFLDLMISLEGMYLKGERQELGYKLRTRMAILLESDFSQRKKVSDDIREAYKYRGQIVHGEGTPTILEDFFLRIRDYARRSLKEFIRKPELRDQMDEIVLGSRSSK